MTVRWGAAWILVLAPGCFRPSYDRPACGPNEACPSGLTCNAQGICDEAGAPIDAAVLGLDGGASGSDCWQRWLAGGLALGEVTEISELTTGGSERDPWISADRLRMYFTRTPIGQPGDIFLAIRTSTAQPFVTSSPVTNLNTSDDEGHASLAQGETLVVLASDRDDSDEDTGDLDVYSITRADSGGMFGSPDQRGMSEVNYFASRRYDPFLSEDGLRLYLAPDSGSNNRQQVVMATRSNDTAEFSAPALVPGINDLNAIDSDPALSLDERVIVFSSTRSGGSGFGDLYYATRSDAVGQFGTPARIPGVNGSRDDGDPMLSADGCTLYFASDRNGGDFDLYTAQVVP